MQVNITDLSVELLLKIFECCSILDLLRLKVTCIRFYDIINHSKQLTSNIMVANQSKIVLNRTFLNVPTYDKFRISYNWCKGKYREKLIVKELKKQMPWLVLSKSCLWYSRGASVQKFTRTKGVTFVKPYRYLGLENVADICKFAYKQNTLVCGHIDGSVFIHIENGKCGSSHHLKHCHQSEVHSVDIENDIVASGSRDKHFKIWPLKFDGNNQFYPSYIQNIEDRIWSVSLCKDQLAVGTSGCFSVPLQIFDLTQKTLKYNLGVNFHRGSGILDMKWCTPQVLLSCGYDTYVRKWDLRSGDCVQKWEDPCNSKIYCMENDNHCTIVTGTDSHGRIVLWDTRQAKFVQMYYLQACRYRHQSSPVYSLSYDTSTLFAATEKHLSVLDFSVRNAKSMDYSSFFSKQITISI